ncbi:unnamed protein product [Umbelopsis vinacea]
MINIVTYAPYVNESSRATWERENNAILQEVAPNNSLVPATQKSYYFPVQWEYPRSRSHIWLYRFWSNQALSGFTDNLRSIKLEDKNGIVGYETNYTSSSSDYTQVLNFNVFNDEWPISCTDVYTPQPVPAIILTIIVLIGILLGFAINPCTRRYRMKSKAAVLHKSRYIRSRHRAQALVQAVPNPLIVLNGDVRVVDCNKQAMDVFCVDEKRTFLGCHIKHLFSDGNQVPLVRNNVVEPGLHEVVVRRQGCRDNFIVEANLSFVEDINDDYEDGPLLTQVVLLRDVSAKKEVAVQLQKAKLEAEDANQRKSQFLAFVCHELRNPLHVISGMSYLLGDMIDNKDKLDYLKNIISSSKYAKYCQRRFRKLLEEESNMTVTLVIDMYGGSVEAVIKVDDSVPEYVNSDKTRIRQITKNLIDNAISNVLFRITDTGMEIPEEQMPEVFQPFSSANISMGNHFGTSGVGLSIVLHLVDLMGGKLKIDSKINA